MYTNDVICENGANCININELTYEKMVELTNRYTPPVNISNYLREQGYCVHKENVETVVEDQNIASENVQHGVLQEDILIDLTEEDCIAECNEDEMHIEREQIKFIITVPPRINSIVNTDCVSMCKNYQVLKKTIIKHLFDDTITVDNRLVVQGTPDDVEAVMAEIRSRCHQTFV